VVADQSDRIARRHQKFSIMGKRTDYFLPASLSESASADDL
jgi:hypothetical protein